MLVIMLDAVYCDTNKKRIVTLQPESLFLPVFTLCNGLKEKNGLTFMPEPLQASGVVGGWSRGR